MTPKEKADDIMQKCILSHVLAISNTKGKLITPYVSKYAYLIVRKDRAKNCALIAVDEIINICLPSSEYGGVITNATIEYWEEVKQEVEKL
jgi:hypothetical protein